MIAAVTINPLLERRYYYPNLNFNFVNRDGKLILKAGGKGINVNCQLNKLGIANIALLFSGGTNGKLLRESLKREGINFSDINIRNESRDASIIIDQSKEKIYSFFGENSEVSSDEVENFIIKMEKVISTCEIVVFSGSSPCRETDKIFPLGISIANRLDKISICDTYGNHLEQCLNASPTIVHNNTEEIRSSLGITLENENDQISLLEMLYKKGIKQAFITNDAKPFYASNFDFHYKVSLPEIRNIDSTGSGDAFVAGLVYGWHNKLTFDEQIRLASALGVRNAESLEVCDVDLKDAESITNRIYVESVGKKLKNINDKPD
jgi:1-phosphofructokinase family hexose kinase